MAWEWIQNNPVARNALAGTAIVTGLAGEAWREQRADMKQIRDFMDKNVKAGVSKVLDSDQMAKVKYGAKLPNKFFEEAYGQKGSLGKWLTSRTAKGHFGPVESVLNDPMMKAGIKGARFLNKFSPAGMGMDVYEGVKGATKAYLDVTNTTPALEDLGSKIYDVTHRSGNGGGSDDEGLITKGTVDPPKAPKNLQSAKYNRAKEKRAASTTTAERKKWGTIMKSERARGRK
jgi:hypothetical protein|tara:strand:+ start:63 stop:755 length:693 start_codon:yes stop_codon:yes gene_type:complete